MLRKTDNRKRDTHMTNIRNEGRAVTKDTIDIKKTREYYEEIYTHNFGIIDETD